MNDNARAYARLRYRLMLVDLGLGMAFLLAFQFSGTSHALAGWWRERTGAAWLQLLGYAAVFASLYYLVNLPLHFYSSFSIEHRFGLSRMTIADWLKRELKQVALSALLGLLVLQGLYALLRHAPATWPVWATVGWVGISVVMARIFPTLLLPLFYKTVPLHNDELTQRLLELCARVGLPALGVFRVGLGAETRKANAALAGLGNTRRVLVSDTLLSEFTPEEIEGVLAHELAHHRYRHILKMLVLSTIGSWLAFELTARASDAWLSSFGVQSLADPAGLPLLLFWFSVLGFIGMPLQNGLSRVFEWEADRFAAAMIKSPKVFADALRRLAQLNLADPAPPRWVVWWFYDHPPIADRISAADRA